MSYPGQPANGTDPYGHVDDFFGGSAKSLHFDPDKGYQIGQWKGGTIVEIKTKQQQTDIRTKEPLTWPDGAPKYTLPVVVQTDERDPSDPHDDGRRTVFIDGGKEVGLRAHLRETRAKLRPGGTLYLAWTSGAGKIGDPKQFAANYTPPAHAAADTMFATPPQQHAQPAPQQPYGAPPAPPQAAYPPAAPVAPQAPQQPNLWQQPAPPAQQQWPAPPPTPPAPAAPVQPPTPVAAAPTLNLDVAYAHLAPEQRAAIAASGMSPDQIASVFGPPQAA